MKRVGLVVVCIAILVLFLARGDQPATNDPEPASEPDAVRIPIPPPPVIDPAEEARGIYVFENDSTRVALELQPERRFRSVARLPGREPLDTSGTWSLGGRTLTLTYRHVRGEPIPDGPKYETARYLGETIELTLPDRSEPLVLRKATFIRKTR